MFSNERKWFNQKIFNYKDTRFSTHNSIDCNISINTEDYINFSSLKLNISIFTPDRSFPKSASFDYIELQHLYNSVKEIFIYEKKNIDIWDNTFEVFMMNRTNKQICIKFKKNKRDEKAIFILIGDSKEDFNYIPLEIEVFKSFFCLINQILNSYISTTISMININLLSEIKRTNNDLSNRIKTLPSQLVQIKNEYSDTNSRENHTNENSSNDGFFNEDELSDDENKTDFIFEKDEPEKAIDSGEKYENVTTQFNDYFKTKERELYSEIKNLSDDNLILKSVKSKPTKINSLFVDKVLKQDLSNFESLLDAITIADRPIESFIKTLNLETDIFKNFLNNFSADEIKSLYFMTKFIQRDLFHASENSRTKSIITTKIPIHNLGEKYKDFACDLITIFLYLKTYVEKIDNQIDISKDEDKYIFYINFRSFMDPLMWGILDLIPLSRLKNLVMLRFKSFKQIGFFKDYDENLLKHGIEITEKDISEVFEILKILVEKPPVGIKFLHESLFKEGVIHIPFINPYKIDFLLNEVIPIEVAIKHGDSFKEFDDFKKYIETPSKELKEIFLDEHVFISKKEKETPYYKYIKFYQDEIPDDIKNEFLTKLKLSNGDKIDVKDYELNEFGEHILKAIYTWNDNPKQSVKEFIKNCDDCILNKNEIISILKDENDDDGEFNENWFE